MRAFTILFFVLTVIAGCLSYYGIGSMTVKLAYAYLALSTAASVLITLTMRPAMDRVPVEARDSRSAELLS
jgi:hypothetical protein